VLSGPEAIAGLAAADPLVAQSREAALVERDRRLGARSGRQHACVRDRSGQEQESGDDEPGHGRPAAGDQEDDGAGDNRQAHAAEAYMAALAGRERGAPVLEPR
jgi:hypothetical protein